MTANFTQPHGLLDYWRDMLISLDYWPCQADSLSPCECILLQHMETTHVMAGIFVRESRRSPSLIIGDFPGIGPRVA